MVYEKYISALSVKDEGIELESPMTRALKCNVTSIS